MPDCQSVLTYHSLKEKLKKAYKAFTNQSVDKKEKGKEKKEDGITKRVFKA